VRSTLERLVTPPFHCVMPLAKDLQVFGEGGGRPWRRFRHRSKPCPSHGLRQEESMQQQQADEKEEEEKYFAARALDREHGLHRIVCEFD